MSLKMKDITAFLNQQSKLWVDLLFNHLKSLTTATFAA